ncbi:MAG: hypothetical protein E6G26_06900 [Actinobacteria bacterium]|nr:MAG: hypothetical protein E6G26_06900 [Actinomycetota bacterium]
MKARLATLGVIAVLAAGLAVPAATAAPPPQAAAPHANLTATLNSATGTIQGTLSNLVFTVNQAGNLVLSGTFTDTLGNVTNFSTTILQATGTCQILDLTLGPLDLNLLGLMVHLDRVHLNITAQSGPGNLLGNLLCGVAHLLDSNASANGLAAVLNNLLRGLGL